MTRIRDVVGSALATAAVSTFGDYVWATWIPRHRPLYGLTHGTLLFLCIGLCLGTSASRPFRGAAAGAAVGFVAAGVFYLLAPLAGRSAIAILMVLLWIALWLGLGLINGRLLQKRGGLGEVLVRSGLAAVGSGLAFYAVSGIWFPFRPRGWDYAVHFVSWTVAYLPGFAALLIERSTPGQR